MENNVETPMLQEGEQQFYKGEKAPESKNVEGKAGVNEPEAVCGVPVGSVVLGEPVEQPRQPWSTGLLCCLGRNDEFCSSDMQVCVLGACAPCVLYGSNMELLHPGQESFLSHCVAYSKLYAIGQLLWNANCLAPCFSVPSRIAIRKAHNLVGHGEHLANTLGCTSLISSDESRERCDAFSDCALHICCHGLALCQEGREIRRRTAQGSQRAHYYTLAPPSQQSME
jgi:Cys-rich protein (TIGR01571 family)